MHNETAIQIRDSFLRGERTAVAITKHFLDRIERLDPQVGAFVLVLKDRALQKAQELDAAKARGDKMGKLAGIPIALKDNIHVTGVTSTCGSKFLTNYVAPFDATVTELLEAEGAIIIGKTNMDEFAMGSSTEHSAIQATHNPWNLAWTPGGSSGGSAAAVAARLCPAAFGSDTGGSVRQPAALCGLVGFKPTYGRVSRFGLVAFGSSLDQISPFALTVEDTALLMEVVGRHCPKDSTSLPSEAEDYMSKLKAGVKGKKIGVDPTFLEGLPQHSRELFDRSLETFKKLGATVVDVNLSLLKDGISVYYILAPAEASTNLARFDGIRYGQRSKEAKTLAEVYDLSKEEGYGREVQRRIMLGTYVLSSGFQDAFYRKAQRVRTLIIRQYEEAFRNCDVIATPVTTDGAFETGSITDPLREYLEDIYTIPANLGGVPAISVPAGFTPKGQPMGFQLTGPQQRDVDVLTFAYAFEQATAPNPAMPELAK
ncbi:MAG: Asp-tRNA(Asn)/Glu-tRNA(Gln) amidotransferase subunit GatA [Chlamydiales bacterium]|nr:Asp-tRNA(Asn)/Glu-tRNA(Gln) amidotransferase subunit GatA [Chlamydiales bacterium]